MKLEFGKSIDKAELLGWVRAIILKYPDAPLYDWLPDGYYEEFEVPASSDTISIELSIYKELDGMEEGVEYTLEMFVNTQYIEEVKFAPDGSFYDDEDPEQFDRLVRDLQTWLS